MTHSKNATIIGSGLIGSLLSIFLQKRGYQVSVFERRPDMRSNRISAGRSINLALSDRGWRGLEAVGIADEIKKVAIPMKGRMIHNIDQTTSFLPYGKGEQAIYSVSRGGLNCVLMDLAEKHGAKIHFNEKCTGVDFETGIANFENTENNNKTKSIGKPVFGTDGAFSATRQQMQHSKDRFNYQISYLEYGYKELTIAPGKDGNFAMEENALHIWPRGNFMLIALPNMDKSFTCTLFFPFEGPVSFEALNSVEKMRTFFEATFPDAVPLMPELEHDFFHNPSSSLGTVKCFPWSIEDKMVMLGDAAHAVVPFYGQGMNCGFEDCVVLDQLIEEFEGDWKTIFKKFEVSRKPNSDAIADLAVANFVEMRDKVTDPQFLLQKKIENWFAERHPSKWIPLYTMVTFSPDLPYSTALQNGKKQDEIMAKILAMPGVEQNWNSLEVEKAILSYL